MARLSGELLTRVFDGPYRNVRPWQKEVVSHAAQLSKRVDKTFFFYTTCPRCAARYGKNYVVALAQVR